jgi:hypothetical protein
LTVFRRADIGLHRHTSDSATPVQFLFEAHWLWFIFIQAHRFSARTAFPSTPRGGTGIEPFRREPSNSTSGTCTHELASVIGCCGAIGSGGQNYFVNCGILAWLLGGGLHI